MSGLGRLLCDGKKGGESDERHAQKKQILSQKPVDLNPQETLKRDMTKESVLKKNVLVYEARSNQRIKMKRLRQRTLKKSLRAGALKRK